MGHPESELLIRAWAFGSAYSLWVPKKQHPSLTVEDSGHSRLDVGLSRSGKRLIVTMSRPLWNDVPHQIELRPDQLQELVAFLTDVATSDEMEDNQSSDLDALPFWSPHGQLKLRSGFSYPIRPAEVDRYFPGVRTVYWKRDRPADLGSEVFVLSWNPRLNVDRQPTLTVQACLSEDRAGIRAWLKSKVTPEACAWLAALEDKESTWVQSKQFRRWDWTSEAD